MSLPNQGIYKIPEESCPCASLLLIVGSPGKFVKGVSCFKGALSVWRRVHGTYFACYTQASMAQDQTDQIKELVKMLLKEKEDAHARQVTQNTGGGGYVDLTCLRGGGFMVLVARQESLHDLVQRLPIAAFNEDAEGSTNRGSSTWNAVTKTECALCGEKSEEKLTRAHIVSDQAKANTFGLPCDNERNMLPARTSCSFDVAMKPLDSCHRQRDNGEGRDVAQQRVPNEPRSGAGSTTVATSQGWEGARAPTATSNPEGRGQG